MFACVRACVCACVRACVQCVCACVRACVFAISSSLFSVCLPLCFFGLFLCFVLVLFLKGFKMVYFSLLLLFLLFGSS